MPQVVAPRVAHVVQYSVVQYSSVQYNAMHYSNVQYSGLYKLFLHPFTQVQIAAFALHTCGEG